MNFLFFIWTEQEDLISIKNQSLPRSRLLPCSSRFFSSAVYTNILCIHRPVEILFPLSNNPSDHFSASCGFANTCESRSTSRAEWILFRTVARHRSRAQILAVVVFIDAVWLRGKVIDSESSSLCRGVFVTWCGVKNDWGCFHCVPLLLCALAGAQVLAVFLFFFVRAPVPPCACWDNCACVMCVCMHFVWVTETPVMMCAHVSLLMAPKWLSVWSSTSPVGKPGGSDAETQQRHTVLYIWIKKSPCCPSKRRRAGSFLVLF